ncbi:MAG TPA: methionine aminotransferase [Povalibacter sp.]|uniref:methionine aminotransferase n=1 Tax=Povalibacter sp. TaxID=1962978 RepID=UPI002BF3D99D|nr:methionine aminotransferase [Povalibacter sp.]HMN44384.1 methionine aminotransferase [Povalibacter sp.]
MNLRSKLPHVGTTIFTVMTNRARELGAINLAQGFPDFDSPELLKELLARSVASGHNQYAPMIGEGALREQIANKLGASYGRTPDPEAEITITLGATEAIFSAVSALVHPGDDVILFDPSYDSYAPAVILAGGRPVHVPLQPPHFRIDWQQVRARVTPRLRLVMINSPHNPTGSILSAGDLQQLADLLRPTDAMVLSDEVYEHMVYDGAKHASVVGHAELYARSVVCFSFGKTMHATGWRVGYAVAPPELTRELRRVHQFNTFSIATPLQLAIAEFLRLEPQHSNELAAFYQRKRDLFLRQLQGSRFRWIPSEGTYFQLLDFSDLSDATDAEFADRVLREAGVASIPVSPFYQSPPTLGVVRFCFAKKDSTLIEAAERLRKL